MFRIVRLEPRAPVEFDVGVRRPAVVLEPGVSARVVLGLVTVTLSERVGRVRLLDPACTFSALAAAATLASLLTGCCTDYIESLSVTWRPVANLSATRAPARVHGVQAYYVTMAPGFSDCAAVSRPTSYRFEPIAEAEIPGVVLPVRSRAHVDIYLAPVSGIEKSMARLCEANTLIFDVIEALDALAHHAREAHLIVNAVAEIAREVFTQTPARRQQHT